MTNAEQHEFLCATLLKLVDVLDCNELSLIAHLCGVRIEDFYPPTLQQQEADLFNEQLRIAA